ncbi:MAG: flagellar basal body-associated FliL family protein [Gemmatimonadetes bacterium]|nr:flagellar basal body-associated FliL family protein [Gemmatimonadota bacterium]
MADEQTEVVAEATEAPKKGKLGPIIIVAGLVFGVGMGAFVAGPTIAHRLAPRPAGDSAEAGKEKKAEAKGEAGKESPVLLLDNLVMNPAASGGQRFLLISIGLQVSDALAHAELKKREIEARDAILRIFGTKTTEDLSDVSQRDGFKKEIKTALDSLLGPNVIRGVFFPQFVLQ